MNRLLIGLTVSVAAVAPRIAHSQRQTYTNTNAWFQISGDVAINERWGILFDASNRRSGPIDEVMANFVRAALAYELTDRVRVAIGGNYSKSYPYGEIPAPYAVPEWRMWEQLALTHSIGNLDLSHRYRLEQRLRGLRSDPDVDETDSWTYTNRFRYQIKGTLPLLGEEVEAGEPYLTAANEFFIAFGKNVGYNIFDQDRAQFAFGYRMNRNWRVETGFMEHIVFKSNGIDVEHNHTFTFGLTYTRPAPKPPATGGAGSGRTHDAP